MYESMGIRIMCLIKPVPTMVLWEYRSKGTANLKGWWIGQLETSVYIYAICIKYGENDALFLELF